MGLPYRMVLRPDLSKDAPADKKLFYPQTRTYHKIGFDRLCREIAATSTASKGDVQISITGLIDSMKTHLSDGDSVQMGDFGTFHAVAGSPGVEKPSDFHTGMFRRARLVFTPGSALRQMLNEMSYEKLSAVPEEPADPPVEGGGEGGGDDVLE